MKCLFFIFSLLVATCAFAQQSSGGESAPAGNASTGGPSSVGQIVGQNYVIQPSDVLALEIYQHTDLKKQVRVEGDGSIELPLINKVTVQGMTVAEAQELIRDLYNRDYLVDPQVSLIVLEFSPKFVRVLGLVNSPGVVRIPPDRDLTLTEAIAAVNGFNRLGQPRKVQIKRVDDQGNARTIEVDFNRIMTDPNARDIVLQEGDTVFVPERLL